MLKIEALSKIYQLQNIKIQGIQKYIETCSARRDGRLLFGTIRG